MGKEEVYSKETFIAKKKTEYADKKYHLRCMEALKKLDEPLEGWKCTEIYDVREDDEEAKLETCMLCGCKRVRFVHRMEHDDSFFYLNVGCICAGVMEGDILAAAEREYELYKRAQRRKYFLKKDWQWTPTHDYCIKYKGYRVYAYKRPCLPGDSLDAQSDRRTCYEVGFFMEGTVTEYCGKPIYDLKTAKYGLTHKSRFFEAA